MTAQPIPAPSFDRTALEAWLIGTLAAFNVRGERRKERVGVWVRRPEKGAGVEDKIAALGIRVLGSSQITPASTARQRKSGYRTSIAMAL